MKRERTVSLLSKMTIRSIKNGWPQFLAVIAIGAIAVTLFVGLLANAQSFENQVNEVYESGNLADLWVTTTHYEEKDVEKIDSLLEEGDAREGRFYIPAEAGGLPSYVAIVHKAPKISKPYGELETLEASPADEFLYFDKETEAIDGKPSLDTFTLGQEISFTMNVASYGINEMASFLNPYVKEGGTNILAEENVSLQSRITGFMHHPENITKASYNTAVVLVSDKTFKKALIETIDKNYTEMGKQYIFLGLKSLLNFNDMNDEYLTNPNQHLITLKDEGRVSDLKGKLQEYFNAKEDNNLYLITSRGEMPFYVTLNNDVTQARQFTFVFPFVFFAVAILVILTTLSQRVLQERSQIGTMKALGLSRGQIYLHYIGLTSVLVGIGTLIGEVLGPIIIPQILGKKYQILYSLPPMRYTFPLLYGILTAVAFLGIAALVTFAICRKEVRLKPVDSMRPEPPKIKMKHVHQNHREKVYLLSMKMAFRNIRISLVKSIMVIVGVMGCTALLACGFGIEDTINYGISHDLGVFYQTDLTLSFATERSYEDSTKGLLAIEGVDKVEPFVSTTSLTYVVNGPQMNTTLRILQPDSQTMRLNFSHDTVAISQKVARTINAKEGDEIVFQYNGNNYTSKVGAILEAFVYHGVFAYTDASFFSSISSFAYGGANVTIKEGYEPTEMDQKMESLNYVQNCNTVAEREATINDIMSGVMVMTNAVKVFAILLAVVVLYNLALMNFKERTRDIATLKVLGFSRVEISLSLMMETLFLTAIGVLLGLALGYPFLLLVMGTNIVELVEYLYTIRFLSYLFSFLLTFVVAFIVDLILVQRTRKVKMVESLKSVE